MSVAFTEAPRRCHASSPATALREGHHEIIAVGGDGTINEAVNGFFDTNGPVSADAVFGFITSGTGGDFRKTFGIEPGTDAAIARLAKASVRSIDVGRVSCVSSRGEPLTRYFINIASFGMSGLIVDSVNRARNAKLFGGSFAFAFHSVVGSLRYKYRPVRIMAGDFDKTQPVSTVAIANGRFFGGGMMVAPDAKPDDGVFDIIVMGGAPKKETLDGIKKIYTGEHINSPNVQVVRADKVVAVPVAETKRQSGFDRNGRRKRRAPACDLRNPAPGAQSAVLINQFNRIWSGRWIASRFAGTDGATPRTKTNSLRATTSGHGSAANSACRTCSRRRPSRWKNFHACNITADSGAARRAGEDRRCGMRARRQLRARVPCTRRFLSRPAAPAGRRSYDGARCSDLSAQWRRSARGVEICERKQHRGHPIRRRQQRGRCGDSDGRAVQMRRSPSTFRA